MTLAPDLIRAGLWKWVKSPGLERFELLRLQQGWIIRGTVVRLAESGPAEASYTVSCDDSWRTRAASISCRDAAGERTLKVNVQSGVWYANGTAADAVASCVDIDLEWSPSTNTIPIRRLNLGVGESSGPLTAAWVRFPALTIQPLLQEYERTSARTYRYTSGGGKFLADLAVDEEGLVLSYEGIWQRET